MLTKEEINLLLEIIRVWEGNSEGLVSEMMITILGAITNKDETDREKTKKLVADLKETNKKTTIARKEQSILLQAKLIQMRDGAEINEVMKG